MHIKVTRQVRKGAVEHRGELACGSCYGTLAAYLAMYVPEKPNKLIFDGEEYASHHLQIKQPFAPLSDAEIVREGIDHTIPNFFGNSRW